MAALPIADDRGRFMRIAEIMLEIGVSRSTIYRLELAGDFPKRVRLSGNSMGWWSPDIDAWKSARRAAPS